MPARATWSGEIGVTPMPGSGAWPRLISEGTTRLTRSTGIAKPMPDELPLAERIAVLTPISRPALSSNGRPSCQD